MRISLFLVAAVTAQLAAGNKYYAEDPARRKRGLRAGGRGLSHHMSAGGWHSAATDGSMTYGSKSGSVHPGSAASAHSASAHSASAHSASAHSASAKAEKEHDPVDAKEEKYFSSKFSKAKAVKSEKGHSDNDEVIGKSAKVDLKHSEEMSVKGTDASAHSESADGESKAGKLFKSKSAKSKSEKSGKSIEHTEAESSLETAASSDTVETAESSYSATAKSHKGEYDHSMGMYAKSSKATHSASAHSESAHSASAETAETTGTAESTHTATAKSHKGEYYHSMDMEAKSSKATHAASEDHAMSSE